MAVATKELTTCIGCTDALYAVRPRRGFGHLCIACYWDPNRAVMLNDEQKKYLLELKRKRKENQA